MRRRTTEPPPQNFISLRDLPRRFSLADFFYSNKLYWNLRCYSRDLKLTHVAALTMSKDHDGSDAPGSSIASLPVAVPTTFITRLRARTRPLAFAVICGSLTLDSFNVTGLTYGQLNIAEHYDVRVTTASWCLSAYSLAFGSLLLLAGRAGKEARSLTLKICWL